MAKKTMLRQLISKWGIMSIDMQTAIENDMAGITEKGKKYLEKETGRDKNGVVQKEKVIIEVKEETDKPVIIEPKAEEVGFDDL